MLYPVNFQNKSNVDCQIYLLVPNKETNQIYYRNLYIDS